MLEENLISIKGKCFSCNIKNYALLFMKKKKSMICFHAHFMKFKLKYALNLTYFAALECLCSSVC